jgi:hypothetical protein
MKIAKQTVCVCICDVMLRHCKFHPSDMRRYDVHPPPPKKKKNLAVVYVHSVKCRKSVAMVTPISAISIPTSAGVAAVVTDVFVLESYVSLARPDWSPKERGKLWVPCTGASLCRHSGSTVVLHKRPVKYSRSDTASVCIPPGRHIRGVEERLLLSLLLLLLILLLSTASRVALGPSGYRALFLWG